MPLRRAVALWRTSAALGLALLATTGCGQTAGSAGSTTGVDPRTHAVLTPAGQNPLVVKGAGFRPYERVRITAKTLRTKRVVTRAGADGAFRATLRGVSGCDSVTVTAVGSKGSHASFNLSQVVCRDS